MNLVLEVQENKTSDVPSMLILFARQKVGKTSALAELESNFIIDLENSTTNIARFMGINIKRTALEESKSNMRVLRETLLELKKLPEDKKPKRVTIDTISELEEWLRDYATILYKNSPMGAKFEGKSIWTDLKDTRIAWDFLRKAWDEFLQWTEGVAQETLILVGHVKDSTVVKDDELIQALDIKIQGAQKTILAGKCSAMGYLYRDPKTSTNYLDFRLTNNNIATGSRIPKLANKQFEISKMNPDGTIQVDWSKIF